MVDDADDVECASITVTLAVFVEGSAIRYRATSLVKTRTTPQGHHRALGLALL